MMYQILLISVGSVISHMYMSIPPAEGYEGNTNSIIPRNYNINAPVECDRIQNPCKYPPGNPIKSYQAGSNMAVKIDGGAPHEGGHVQFGFSYNRLAFAITHTETGINGNELRGPFQIKIPNDAPSGNVTFIWAWHNKVGTREMYINCVNIEITNGKSPGSIKGKELLIGNIKGYRKSLFPAENFTKQKGDEAFKNQKHSEVKPSDEKYEVKYPKIKDDTIIKECDGEINEKENNYFSKNDYKKEKVPENIPHLNNIEESNKKEKKKSDLYLNDQNEQKFVPKEKSRSRFKDSKATKSNEKIDSYLDIISKNKQKLGIENKTKPSFIESNSDNKKLLSNSENDSQVNNVQNKPMPKGNTNSRFNYNQIQDPMSKEKIIYQNSKEKPRKKRSMKDFNKKIDFNKEVLKPHPNSYQQYTSPHSNYFTQTQHPSGQEVDSDSYTIRRPPHHRPYKFKYTKNGWS